MLVDGVEGKIEYPEKNHWVKATTNKRHITLETAVTETEPG